MLFFLTDGAPLLQQSWILWQLFVLLQIANDLSWLQVLIPIIQKYDKLELIPNMQIIAKLEFI